MELLLIFIALIWLCIIQSKQSELKTESDKIQKELKQLQNISFEPVIKQDKEYNDCEASSKTSTPDETFDTPYENSTNDENNAKIPDKPLIETKENKNDVEKLFLGNIFNKIGALAIFVGLIIFIKLISPYIIFTPWIKLSLGFLTGFAFIGASLFIRTKEKMRNYSEVLLGVGFGALFITTYCGSTILELLDTPVVFTIATALLLAAYYMADKLKTVSMLSISLIAGYLNPFFINRTFDAEPDFL